MSNTPSDEEIWDLIPDEWTMTIQHAPGAKALVLCNVEDFARAVLAKWGTPQPVVREPMTADELRLPKDGQQWRVEWWNESCRMLLPANKKLDSFQAYRNGTLMFTIKECGFTQKGGSNADT